MQPDPVGDRSAPSLDLGCFDPQPSLTQGGIDTGLVQCADRFRHRPTPVECPNHLAERPTGMDDDCDEACQLYSTCRQDSDCAAQPYGRCIPARGQRYQLECAYGCVADSDCGDGQACLCGETIGQCIAADCRQDADCHDGILCAEWFGDDGTGCSPEPSKLACQTPQDECRTSWDCLDGSFCTLVDSKRICLERGQPICGRPFLVDGQARVASLVPSDDFPATNPLPELEALSSVTRR